jgi:membrane fusion protein, multidrug efflux system
MAEIGDNIPFFTPVISQHKFDFVFSSRDNACLMTQGFSILSRWCACLLVLPALGVMTGCKKKQSASPSGQNFPTQVVMVEARQQPISEKLALVGSLAGNEVVEIKSETDGNVAEIHFQEGKPVKKGDLLIQLDESKLAASVAEAEANLKLSQVTLGRNKQLYNERLISQQEFDQASALFDAHRAAVDLRKRQLQDTRIYAPFSGTAGARMVSPGQVISKDTVLTSLVDASIIKAEFNVPERFLGEVKVGQSIELTVAAFPKDKFRGEAYFIAPRLDEATRTALVKAQVNNADGKLKPGMFANLDLTVTTRDSAIVIPESALVRIMQDDRATVYAVTSSNTVAIRPVKVGVRLPGRVEVIEGLNAGDRIIVEGVQKVGPGSRVVAAPEKPAPDSRGEEEQGSR